MSRESKSIHRTSQRKISIVKAQLPNNLKEISSDKWDEKVCQIRPVERTSFIGQEHDLAENNCQLRTSRMSDITEIIVMSSTIPLGQTPVKDSKKLIHNEVKHQHKFKWDSSEHS